MSERLAISILLPVLNETSSLRETVQTIQRVAQPHVCEMLIITAGRTTPESLAVIDELLDEYPEMIRVHRQQSPGLGGALREGFELSRGSHLLLMASDLETDPAIIPQFIDTMQDGGWDIVTASRWRAGGGFEGYGRVREALNKLFQTGCRLLYGTRLTDLTFAYRLYKREILQGITWSESGHPFLLECLLKPLRCGASVTEIPCVWQVRREGDSANSLWQMAAYTRTAVLCRCLPRSRFLTSGAS